MKCAIALLSLLVVTAQARSVSKRQRSTYSKCTSDSDCTAPEVCFTYIEYDPNYINPNISLCQIRGVPGNTCNVNSDCIPSEECAVFGRNRACAPRREIKELASCTTTDQCKPTQQCVHYTNSVRACISYFNATASIGDSCEANSDCPYSADCTVVSQNPDVRQCTANGRAEVPPDVYGEPYPGMDNATATMLPVVTATATATDSSTATVNATSVATSTATSSVIADNATTTVIADNATATVIANNATTSVVSSSAASSSVVTSSAAQVTQAEPSKEAASQSAPPTPVVSAPVSQATVTESTTSEHASPATSESAAPASSKPVAVETHAPTTSAAPASSAAAMAPTQETHGQPQLQATSTHPAASVVSPSDPRPSAMPEAAAPAPAPAPVPVCPPVIDLSEVLQYLRDIKQELECVKSDLAAAKSELDCVKTEVLAVKTGVKA